MRKPIIISKKMKFLNQSIIMNLLDDLIIDSYSGRRTKRNGSRISEKSIKKYEFLKKILLEYSIKSKTEFKIFIVNNLTQLEKENANVYYKEFYSGFTNFLYDEKKYFDNFVGVNIKCLRTFFNYLELDRTISVGNYHKTFFVPKEDIPIIALSTQQLSYIINDSQFNLLLKEKNLSSVRDLFVFGCVVALRISDLLQLTSKNLFYQDKKYYLKVKSQKTKVHTSIKLPDFAVDIIKKQDPIQNTLFPPISLWWFNNGIKSMAKLIPNDFQLIKTRERRGKSIIIYKDEKTKTHYKLSDHLSSHTMRRTAITYMLSLGMPEHIVRKVSGHANNSPEFYRYVHTAQNIIDVETDKIFKKLIVPSK